MPRTVQYSEELSSLICSIYINVNFSRTSEFIVAVFYSTRTPVCAGKQHVIEGCHFSVYHLLVVFLFKVIPDNFSFRRRFVRDPIQ